MGKELIINTDELRQAVSTQVKDNYYTSVVEISANARRAGEKGRELINKALDQADTDEKLTTVALFNMGLSLQKLENESIETQRRAFAQSEKMVNKSKEYAVGDWALNQYNSVVAIDTLINVLFFSWGDEPDAIRQNLEANGETQGLRVFEILMNKKKELNK